MTRKHSYDILWCKDKSVVLKSIGYGARVPEINSDSFSYCFCDPGQVTLAF